MHSRRGILRASATVAAGFVAAVSLPTAADAAGRPDRVPLPDGFAPEGIEISPRGTAYVTSRVSGSIYRADLKTGTGSVFVTGPGTPSLGLKLDRRNRLFVSGGTGGDARIVDAATGEVLAGYRFAAAGTAFVNDVVLTRRAAYFTDSWNPVLYRLPLTDGLPHESEVTTIPLSGIAYTPGAVNVNGIVDTPDGRALLVVQSNTGLLFRVDATTGAATQVDLGGELLTFGDGLLRDCDTLYAVQNRANQLAVVDLPTGTVTARITDPSFDTPATFAAYAGRLYFTNARFTTPVTPTTTYDVVSLRRP
ncbi:sugar lactone lactonase YvrE [Hamadaea flava]|uniref:SMP-30/gluconolactonase/LRE family protein n=2 Tax=Hamadaea flava TaxID=1742688 RepID=A0ABV8LPF1_9ACTN|nr:sugar lactone lactonase YvrE [Hamadaea flava]